MDMNIPTVVPKTIRPAESKLRQTVRSRNRATIKSAVSKPRKRKLNYDEKVSEVASNNPSPSEDEVLVDKENCSNCVRQRARQSLSKRKNSFKNPWAQQRTLII